MVGVVFEAPALQLLGRFAGEENYVLRYANVVRRAPFEVAFRWAEFEGVLNVGCAQLVESVKYWVNSAKFLLCEQCYSGFS